MSERRTIGVVLLVKSHRFGISVRGVRARFKWEEDGVVSRCPLSTWDARLTSSSTAVRVAVDSLADE